MTELKRTYHPIGQGAFYTEVFTNSDNTKFVMVYDCGTETANNVLDISLHEFSNNLYK